MGRILTVKQINNYISGVFDDEIILHDVCVTGEVFEFKISQNNTFIILKEEDNILECYKYGKLEHLEKGAKVTVRGRIKYYPKGGKISLTVSEIKYTGEGQYHIEFQKLKQTLKENGYFDNKNKLPPFIKKVALITSTEGAVIHDFMSVINKEHGYIDVEAYGVSVQGNYSKDEITKAIAASNNKGVADVIVIARGGGSYQDLLPFNTEELAKAVFNSRIPVISAVGHETDFTLCDFCSVLRAPTPSLAAESIEKINQSWFDKIYGLLYRAADVISDKLNRNLDYVSMLTRKLAHKNELALGKIESRVRGFLKDANAALSKKLIRGSAAVQSKASLLSASIQKLYKESERKFCTTEAKLDSLSPLKLMSGGYARVVSDGASIKSVRQIERNKIVKVVFFDGVFTAKVIDVIDN